MLELLFIHTTLGKSDLMCYLKEEVTLERSIFPERYDLDGTTKKVLLKIIEKKKKYDKLKNRHLFIMWFTIFASFCYFIWLYKHIAIPYSHSFAVMFSVYVEESANLYLLFLLIGAFGYMNVMRQKRDKAEKEYHDLRCEFIDKSKDLFGNSETWNVRHEIYNTIKESYDINLFHQAK